MINKGAPPMHIKADVESKTKATTDQTMHLSPFPIPRRPNKPTPGSGVEVGSMHVQLNVISTWPLAIVPGGMQPQLWSYQSSFAYNTVANNNKTPNSMTVDRNVVRNGGLDLDSQQQIKLHNDIILNVDLGSVWLSVRHPHVESVIH
jgi:hypothetical protein